MTEDEHGEARRVAARMAVTLKAILWHTTRASVDVGEIAARCRDELAAYHATKEQR